MITSGTLRKQIDKLSRRHNQLRAKEQARDFEAGVVWLKKVTGCLLKNKHHPGLFEKILQVSRTKHWVLLTRLDISVKNDFIYSLTKRTDRWFNYQLLPSGHLKKASPQGRKTNL